MSASGCCRSECWDSSARAGDFKKLNKLLERAGSVLGTPQELLEMIVQRRILRGMKNTMDGLGHPLPRTIMQQRTLFGRNLLETDHYKRSLPFEILISVLWCLSIRTVYIYSIFSEDANTVATVFREKIHSYCVHLQQAEEDTPLR